MNKEDYIKSLNLALEAERKSDEDYYANHNKKTSLQQKVNAGMAWSNIEFKRKYFTIGEQIEIEWEKRIIADIPHRLKVGMGCALHLDFPEERILKGVISYLNRSKIKIIINSNIDYLDDLHLTKGKQHIELVFDEKPYMVMRQALSDITSSKNPLVSELLLALCTNKDIYQHKAEAHLPVALPHLNESQNRAINECIINEKFSIIHGPPGTGKTTTITELVRQLCKTERKILVTASSNNAVDLLCEGIAKRQVDILRIGNITRINDDILQHTLIEKARNHADWNHIKKVKIQAEEARKEAKSYKRNFGNDEKQHRAVMYQEYKELRTWARNLEERLLESIVDKTKVIATTLIGASHYSITDLRYDTVIIDEASQTLEPECWNVILKAKRLILVGDHKQLPPTVKSKEAEKLGLATTLLDKLTAITSTSYLLNLQYRMNEAILGFSNKRFYNNLLLSNESNKSQTIINDTTPLIYIDTAGCGFDENFNHNQKSYHNEAEYFIIREFLLRYRENLLGSSIAIVTPYSSQVKFVRQQLSQDEDLIHMEIESDSIDGFQGQERDCIIISLVRSNTNSEIGFLKDERRLNVALTRAKKKLVIIGDSATLATHPLFADLFDHIDKEGQYQSAWEYMA